MSGEAATSLQDKIKEIASDQNIPQEERIRKIQELYSKRHNVEKHSHSGTVQQTDCSHYRRNTMIKAACCGGYFHCRICHDELCDHKINRFDTKTMMCNFCKEEQPIKAFCKNDSCRGAQPPIYYCDICKLWSFEEGKEIFHCDDCGFCRVGSRDAYFHCNSCNLCLLNELKDKHPCLTKTAEDNCPVCYEYMFSSRNAVKIMKCGHSMHADCFQKYINALGPNSQITCPFCKKTVLRNIPLERMLAFQLENTEMPEECRNKRVEILCHDCGEKTICPFHYLGHRCSECQSFNTVIVKTFTVDE